jgi:amino acid transporter
VSVRGAAFIGIGSMVGAGIFALLGQAAVIAGSAVWLSFLLAGGVTMLLAYNVVKLGIRYPSQGGLIEYLRQGFGNGRLLGVAAWLGYTAAFVVVVAMLAVSFGAYAVSLFLGDGAWGGWDNVFASLVIVVMTLINMIGATFVSRVASVMVVVLLGVFSVFIVVTIKEVNFDLLAVSGYPSFSKIIASIALTFFAFLGFGVMTFTVASLRDPKRELPRAVALALGLTTATYVLIAIGVFGTLTVDQAIGYGETAIAEAARPALGDAGFTLMAVAALIATAGATNGTSSAQQA